MLAVTFSGYKDNKKEAFAFYCLGSFLSLGLFYLFFL